ncbi:MAG TPA: hypothetical protein VGG57_11175 [Stellaceae bacterium]|jgi:hypothetical protein
MTAISEPFVPAAQRRSSPRVLEWVRWALLGIVFVASGIVLGCVAGIRPAR